MARRRSSNWIWTVCLFGLILCTLPALASGQKEGAPPDIRREHDLPSRYPYVVQDVLRFCHPKKGMWVDLGAGKGQLTIPLIEATGNAVIMLDPNVESLAKGLELARSKGLADRLFAVVGVAEKMPFLDNSVDLVTSRGAIFFFDDPAQGLREVYRVLRPGGCAYIGGGAGSKYPQAAAKQLIQQRKDLLHGENAEKWRRFVALRRPEQMRKWAQEAGLTDFEVMGEGAISAADPRVGQGVWLFLRKK